MRRALIACLGIIVLWFGLKDWVYRTINSQGEPLIAEQLDYSDAAAWIERPAIPPPGGWETPWGVDVFLVAPPSTRPAKNGEILIGDNTIDAALVAFDGLPVYAPRYRQPSPAVRRRDTSPYDDHSRADITAAFDQYLETDNLLRGLLIAVPEGHEALVEDSLAEIRADADLRQRFAGVLSLTAGADQPPEALDGVICSDAMEGQCVIAAAMPGKRSALGILTPTLPAPPRSYALADAEAATIAVSSRAALLSEWLDEALPKPAEPLGGFDTMESIEIAPIRRPGQTDEAEDTSN